MKKRERIKVKSIDHEKFYAMVEEIKKENERELEDLKLDISRFINQINGSIIIHDSLRNDKYRKMLMKCLKDCGSL